MITIPKTDFEDLLERAACRGARRALTEVGLADDKAAGDIRTLRDLVYTLKTAQKTVLTTVVRWVTIGVLALVVYGAVSKFNILE